jgi:hypothetical protein
MRVSHLFSSHRISYSNSWLATATFAKQWVGYCNNCETASGPLDCLSISEPVAEYVLRCETPLVPLERINISSQARTPKHFGKFFFLRILYLTCSETFIHLQYAQSLQNSWHFAVLNLCSSSSIILQAYPTNIHRSSCSNPPSCFSWSWSHSHTLRRWCRDKCTPVTPLHSPPPLVLAGTPTLPPI